MSLGHQPGVVAPAALLTPGYIPSPRWGLLSQGKMCGRGLDGLGRSEDAEAALRELQQEFLDRRMPVDAILVSLDLAVVLFKSGKALYRGSGTEGRVIATRGGVRGRRPAD
jgi:hypothetical protein